MTGYEKVQKAIELGTSLREKNHSWYIATGYSTENGFEIVVYVTAPKKAEKFVPKTFEGITVVLKKMSGRPRPA